MGNFNLIRVVIPFCFLGTIMGCGSNLPTVTPIEKTTNIESQRGVFYSLPKTVIRIEIPITETSRKPGSLFVEAEWFYTKVAKVGLEREDITQKESKTYSIEKEKAAVSTITMPDEKNSFFVKLDSKVTKDLSLTINLSKDGLLESAKTDSTNRAFDIGEKTLQSAASIVGTLSGAALSAFTAKGPESGKSGAEGKPEEQRVDDQIIAIEAIRVSRFDLITGTANMISGGLPAETLKLMLSELENKEETLMNALRGTTKKKEWTAIFEIEPESKKVDGKNIIFKEDEVDLFSISKSDGISELSGHCINYYSNPFEIKFNKSSDLIKMKIYVKEQLATMILPNEKNESGSFYYRIPLQAKVELTKNDKTFMVQNIYLAQIGPIRQLPKDFKGKFGLLDLIFYTDTGSIKKIDTQTKAIEISEAVGTIGTSATNLTEKILTSDDELTKLERKKKLLELKKEIKDLEGERN